METRLVASTVALNFNGVPGTGELGLDNTETEVGAGPTLTTPQLPGLAPD